MVFMVASVSISLGHIHTKHRVPHLCQNGRHGAGATGQIHNRPGCYSLTAEDIHIKINRGFIVHIVGQPVIAGRQSMISIHYTTSQRTNPARDGPG